MVIFASRHSVMSSERQKRDAADCRRMHALILEVSAELTQDFSAFIVAAAPSPSGLNLTLIVMLGTRSGAHPHVPSGAGELVRNLLLKGHRSAVAHCRHSDWGRLVAAP